MDDYTWRKRLEARRRRRKIERIIIACFFVLAIAGIFSYFAVYTKTPEYAALETVEAVRENDAETLRRHMDFNAIMVRAYDDLTGDMFKYDTRLSERERSLFENFYVLIRPQICQGAVKVIDAKLDTGNWTLPEGMLKGRQLGIDFDLLLERSLIRHTTVVSVENVEHYGERAVADVKVVEDLTQTPFTLKVTLENVSGRGWHIGEKEFELFGKVWKFSGLSFGRSDWKVIAVDNYKDYLDAVAPLLMQDVGNYIDGTAEIISRYNGVFRNEQSTFIVAQKTPGGIMTDELPTLENRQAELDSVTIPTGATYLANLRRESTNVTIQAWQSYYRGLVENNSAAFDTAESLHKQELILDQRIEEIVHNSAVARNLPELP